MKKLTFLFALALASCVTPAQDYVICDDVANPDCGDNVDIKVE